MEINDFDKIVKEQMTKMEVVPSAGSKKALLFKLFFANLFVYHRIKLIVGLFTVTSVIYLGVVYFGNEEAIKKESDKIAVVETAVEKIVNSNFSEEESRKLLGEEEQSSNNSIANNKAEMNAFYSVDDNRKESKNQSISTNYVDISEESPVLKSNQSLAGLDNKKNEFNTTESDKTKISKASNYNVKNKTKSLGVDKSKSNLTGSEVSENLGKNSVLSNKSIDSNVGEKLPESTIVNKGAKQAENDIERVEIISGGIITEISLSDELPDKISLPSTDDYANDSKKRGFTIDGYFSPINYNDIDNKLDATLQEYNWDFYKEYDYVKTGANGGININYNWNNFKIGTGIQVTSLRDYKSKYEYLYLAGNFGGQSISGTVVYDVDTSLVFYVNPLNQELHEELETPYNTYTYFQVPLTLGYELDLKYVSIELNGGVQYGRLMKAKGVEVATSNLISDPYSAYFYDDKYMRLLNRKSDNLNPNQFALIANATLRVRLTKSFDLYSSFNYTQSKSSIYDDKYFLQKTYRNYGVKFGVTYYLNKRLKLKEITSTSF